MSLTEYINASWVVLLIAAMCFWYSYVLLGRKDIDKIRLKGSKPVPKSKRVAYANEAGRIMLGTAISALIIAVIRYFNQPISFILMVILFVAFIILWKKTYDKYE